MRQHVGRHALAIGPSLCKDPFVGPWHRVGCSILQLQKAFAPRSIKGGFNGRITRV